MKNKIGIVTTFPAHAFKKYAKVMIQGIAAYWPAEIELFIQLDPGDESVILNEEIKTAFTEIGCGRLVNICIGYDTDQELFLERNQNRNHEQQIVDYRFQYVKFSHKIFALKKAKDYAIANQFTHLIWLDADVITHSKLTAEDVQSLLPSPDEAVSYLGRKDWDHSECGFMAFDLSSGAKIIDKMYEMYITDEVLTLDQWHDSYVFDQVRISAFIDINIEAKNLSAEIRGRDVFNKSPLGKWMDHLKGPQKDKGIEAQIVRNGAISLEKMKIATQNCVNHDVIRANITENLTLIDKWIEPLNANNEELAMVSAGPSLDPMDFLTSSGELRFPNRKIVTVKHAIERLLSWGIVPWGCILLDPRPHVEEFVKNPHPDVIYFVASMVDPSVTKKLKECGAKIIGYHAAVGAEEQQILPPDARMVCGGSATSTRGIGLFEVLGFRTFHLYGYDLCSYSEPNLQETKQNGKLVWEKVTLSTRGWNEVESTRTFWTKGEFLAQAKEFRDLYMDRESIKILTYGNGMIPWIHHQEKARRNSAIVSYKKTYSGPCEINEFVKRSLGNERKESCIEAESRRSQDGNGEGHRRIRRRFTKSKTVGRKARRVAQSLSSTGHSSQRALGRQFN